MNKLFCVAAVGLLALAACKKTGDNSYEIQKPVIGTQTDTVHTPTMTMDSTKVAIPKISISKETTTVAVPKVH